MIDDSPHAPRTAQTQRPPPTVHPNRAPPTLLVGGARCVHDLLEEITRAHPLTAPPDRPASPATARHPLPNPALAAAQRLEAVMDTSQHQDVDLFDVAFSSHDGAPG